MSPRATSGAAIGSPIQIEDANAANLHFGGEPAWPNTGGQGPFDAVKRELDRRMIRCVSQPRAAP